MLINELQLVRHAYTQSFKNILIDFLPGRIDKGMQTIFPDAKVGAIAEFTLVATNWLNGRWDMKHRGKDD